MTKVRDYYRCCAASIGAYKRKRENNCTMECLYCGSTLQWLSIPGKWIYKYANTMRRSDG